MTIFISHVSPAASVPLTWVYSLFSSPPSQVKVKIYCAWKLEQTSMWTVDLRPCYWKSLVCHPSVWCKPYIVGFFFFHSDNLFTEPARSGEKIPQMPKTCHAAHGGCGGGGESGGRKCPTTHSSHSHFLGGKYSCFCRCQIALKICCRAVIFESRGHLPFVRRCPPSVLLCLVIGQFLLADWNQVSVQRPRYLKSLS